jgi:general secretion pathway protein J
MKMSKSQLRGQGGFSLIELMVALTIFAIIAVISQQSMLSAMAQSSRLSEHSTDLAELELAVSLVTRDLENIAPRPIRSGLSNSEPALVLSGNGQNLTFTRGGLVDPTGRARSPFLRVAYSAAKGAEAGVERGTWTQIDRPSSAVPRQAALWSGIDAIHFQVYADGQWVENWPQPDNADLAVLPDGIAVTLDTKNWGLIRRVVALR